MTQRFGRNKRRAARQAVETAQTTAAEAVERSRKDREIASRADRLMRDMAERIIAAVGPDSALLPLGVQREHRQREGLVRYPVRRDIDNFMVFDPKAEVSMLDVTRSSIELYELAALVERRPSDFSTLIRFVNLAEGKGGQRGFSPRYCMVSDETLQTIGMRRDVEWLAREIAEQLMSLEKR